MVDCAIFSERARLLRERVAEACAASGRPADAVGILPVTKTHPVDAARCAYAEGFPAVGENRVQEALGKIPDGPAGLRWELIGHLQSNKAKAAAEHFDRVQSVDSEKLLHRLDDAAAQLGKCLPVLLEVNTGGDPNKFGFTTAAAPAALEAALRCNHLRVEGLMTIAPLVENPDAARRAFEGLRELRDRLTGQFGASLPELSMGMSGDLEAAIAAGSTLIRVGSALFGPR